MSAYINQMLGCLIVAAGIGGVVGWLLRHVSAGTTAEQLASVTAMMRLKEQMLEKARYQLRDSASKMHPLKEEEVPSSQECSVIVGDRYVDTDRLHRRLQESESAGGLVEWLDVQLAKRDEQHQIALYEVELQLAERDRRIHELERLHQQLSEQAEDNEALPIDKAA